MRAEQFHRPYWKVHMDPELRAELRDARRARRAHMRGRSNAGSGIVGYRQTETPIPLEPLHNRKVRRLIRGGALRA